MIKLLLSFIFCISSAVQASDFPTQLEIRTPPLRKVVLVQIDPIFLGGFTPYDSWNPTLCQSAYRQVYAGYDDFTNVRLRIGTDIFQMSKPAGYREGNHLLIRSMSSCQITGSAGRLERALLKFEMVTNPLLKMNVDFDFVTKKALFIQTSPTPRNGIPWEGSFK